jgi:glycosyltransferase involved in cell wall biosynthesis
MKVGLLTYGLDRPLTGISRYTVELAKALANLADGPEITLLQAGPAPALDGGAFRKVALPGCRRLPGLMTLGNFLVAWQARRLALDVIHDPIGVAPFLFGAGRAKMVVTLHDVFPWSYPGASTLLENIIYRHWLPRTIGRAHSVITASEQSRKDILRFLPISPARLSVLPYGVAACFHPLPAPDARDCLIHRFDVSFPFILYAGPTAPRKNVARLVEAFARLAEEFPLIRLILAGSQTGKTTSMDPFSAGGRLSDRILRIGPVSDSDLAALYNRCDLFVFPSLYEGFGLPPLEAMACGAPVVCSYAASLPEVVGDAARLVDPADTRALTDAMREVLAHPELRAEMQKKGLLQARKFSWERNALETMEVYRKVVYH